MLCRRESSKGPGAEDRAWLSPYQLIAVVVFLTLFACLVVWTTVAMPLPIPEVNIDVLVPALASSTVANGRPANHEEAP
jgi:hypothetical protein